MLKLFSSIIYPFIFCIWRYFYVPSLWRFSVWAHLHLRWDKYHWSDLCRDVASRASYTNSWDLFKWRQKSSSALKGCWQGTDFHTDILWGAGSARGNNFLEFNNTLQGQRNTQGSSLPFYLDTPVDLTKYMPALISISFQPLSCVSPTHPPSCCCLHPTVINAQPPCGQNAPSACRWTYVSLICRYVLYLSKTAFAFTSALFMIFSVHRNNKDLNQVLCELHFLTFFFWEVLERHFLRIYLAFLFLSYKCIDHMSIPRPIVWRDQVVLYVFYDIMHVTGDLLTCWLRKESQPNLQGIIPHYLNP